MNMNMSTNTYIRVSWRNSMNSLTGGLLFSTEALAITSLDGMQDYTYVPYIYTYIHIDYLHMVERTEYKPVYLHHTAYITL